jgi:tetratricopeptide (TPR) repeat protein
VKSKPLELFEKLKNFRMDLYSLKWESFQYLTHGRTFQISQSIKDFMLRYDKSELNYYHMVWNKCNTDQDKLVVSYEASRMSVVSGQLEGSIHWIRTMLPLLRNDPGSNDKELGTFLSVLGSKLMEKNEPEEAIKVLGEAMLKIKNIPDSDEKDMLVRENYRAFGDSFFNMDKDILAIYYFTMYLSFDHLVEERINVKDVNKLLSASYFRIGQLEQSIKYAQDHDAINNCYIG